MASNNPAHATEELRVPVARRIVSVDQFRGYTVAGMFLVNFLGSYACIPLIFKHSNTYCSYADTIMPQFFFAVGFAYRLTFMRRLEKQDAWRTYKQAIWRYSGLILLGLAVYGLDAPYSSWTELKALGVSGFVLSSFKDSPWQALVHIGVTGLWVLPVIDTKPVIRIGFILASATIHLAVLHAGYYEWVFVTHTNDGGPLGFLPWTVPVLVGSLAYDAVSARGPSGSLKLLIAWGIILMLAGYAMSCITVIRQSTATAEIHKGLSAWLIEPPFVPPSHPTDLWTMSQRAGTISYHTFAAGFSLAVLAIFVVVSDLGTFQLGLFRTLGRNALAAYLIHNIVADNVARLVPRDSPLWYTLLGFSVFFGITYIFVRHLEKEGIYLRL